MVVIARYHRVSTEHQSLERQSQSTDRYIDRKFDEPEVVTFTDASTGTNTSRDEYQEMMATVDKGEFDAVVIKSISRISRSIRDLDRTVERLREGGASLHIIDESLQIRPDENDPMQDAIWQLLGVFAEFEAEMTKKRIKEGIAARQNAEDYHHGPAPLGFTKDDGTLIESAEYDRVCAVLDMVDADEISKSEAARRLESSRPTINRALERGELYGV